jgi:hypothetical protein
MVYVYAVTDPFSEALAETGFANARLRTVTGGRLAAVVSDHDDAPLVASEDDLWTHERVVEELVAQRPALPMRFGSMLRDDGAVAAMLADRQAELISALRRVRGAVELGVRVAWEQPAKGAVVAGEASTAARGPGAAYLLGLSATRRRASALAERLDHSVASLAHARVQRLLAAPTLPVTAAYLVDRERVESFRRRIVALDAELPDAAIVCTGPWPPYSFARGDSR